MFLLFRDIYSSSNLTGFCFDLFDADLYSQKVNKKYNIVSGTVNLKTLAFEAAKISKSASKRFMSKRSLHLSCKCCSFHLTEYVKTTVLLFKKYKIDTLFPAIGTS